MRRAGRLSVITITGPSSSIGRALARLTGAGFDASCSTCGPIGGGFGSHETACTYAGAHLGEHVRVNDLAAGAPRAPRHRREEVTR